VGGVDGIVEDCEKKGGGACQLQDQWMFLHGMKQTNFSTFFIFMAGTDLVWLQLCALEEV